MADGIATVAAPRRSSAIEAHQGGLDGVPPAAAAFLTPTPATTNGWKGSSEHA
jgi:hypothetical protein